MSVSPKQNPRIVPSPSSGDSPEDIPFALRDPLDSPYLPPQSRRFAPPPWWIMGLMISVAAATLTSVFWVFNLRPQQLGSAPTNGQGSVARPTPTPEDTLLGHRHYQEADRSTLVAVDTSEHLLRKAAAEAFMKMQDAAKADGVNLVVLSAFRSIEDQKYLFFDVKSSRGQDTATRAEVSAPPGYSEHHTGYAIDIGDGADPSTNVNVSFEQSAAFRWLQANAHHYSFELSFLPHNAQGVAYEPWHWRYVGDQDSLETFYKDQPPPSPRPASTTGESPESPSSDNSGAASPQL